MTTIAIAGAGGQLGRRTAELLLDRPDAAERTLVLVSRDPSKLADLAARGAETRHGDFDQPETLDAAFAGVDRLLLVSTNDIGRRTEQQVAAVDGAKRAGVRHVVYTSLPNPGPDPHPTGALAAEHHATEEAMKASGLAWTFLRNALYADLQVASGAQAVASGTLYTNAGDGRSAYVTREDCAATAAAVLAGEGHEGQAYDVTGPELLTQQDVAAALTAVTGKPVEVVAVDDAAAIAGMVAGGVPEPLAEVFAGFGRAIREGLLDTRTDVVERLTGRAPQRLADLLAAHRAELLGEPAAA
jgi:NAD(P)H dehydrogenase (quinone)